MFKRILVPLDGSPRAERALPVAARLARASNGSLILVQALSVDAGLSLAPEPTVAATHIDTKFAKAEQYLRHNAASTELMGLSTEVAALFGAAAPTLLAVADYYGADLIVMCSHGYTGMKRWILGSVAEKVVHHSSIPVLVLREGGPIPTGSHPDATRPLHLLVPLDGSTLAQVAIGPAASLIAALAAPALGTLHLVRVVRRLTREEELQSLDITTSKNSLHKAKEYMISIAEHLREGLFAPAVAQLKLPITWSVVVDTDVARPFKGSRFSNSPLAHAALHTGHGLILVFEHPLLQVCQNSCQPPDALRQQFGGGHCHTCACHHCLQDVKSGVDTTGEGEIRFDASIENSDPTQRQTQFRRRAQF